jgi:hypothetical protein
MESSENQALSVQREQVDDVLGDFREWLNVQEARWRAGTDRQEFHSPRIVAGDSLLDTHHRLATVRRPSVATQVFRTLAWGFLVTVIVGAALVWNSSDDKTKDMIRAWVISPSGSSSVLRNNSHAGFDVVAEPVSKTSDGAAIQDAAPLQAAPVNQSTPASLAAALSTENQHRLDTMGNDIAVVQRLVEKLVTRQEQMAQDRALNGQVLPDIGRTILPLSPPWITRSTRAISFKGVARRQH